MAKKRCLMVGGSGMAGRWIEIWSGLLGERVEIVGLVDVSREVLKERGDALDLTEGQRLWLPACPSYVKNRFPTIWPGRWRC